MSMPGLNLDHIPPLHIPFRFFNTAPWMGVMAALVLFLGLINGVEGAAFASQWNAELLAFTHLLTLGFMAMTMIGALFQVLPVISGETIPANTWVAMVVHLTLLVGALSLAAAFALSQFQIFLIAVPLLLLAFSVFLLALGIRLIKNIAGGDSINAIRLAALSLVITIAVGSMRAMEYLNLGSGLSIPNVTTIHLGWGLAGWLSLLVMGVSFQVIPMFHVTPNFSRRITRWLPPTVFSALLVLSFVHHSIVQLVVLTLLCGSLGFYSAYALWLLGKRRRKLPDTTVNFWRLALSNLLLLAVCILVRYVDSSLKSPLLGGHYAALDIVIGMLAILGFACSVIIGMLHKIIPFLIYMHLQRLCAGDFTVMKTLPNMLTIIPAKRGKTQFYLHVGTLLLLVCAALLPGLGVAAAVLMGVEFGYLGITVNKATWLYWKTRRRVLVSKTLGSERPDLV